ncbi:mitochondrial Rho GTPase 1-like [Pyrus ussuriensis x Pyrus communis]|uniref:Mitochondrial Rho GTPase 1-like n=1 Tax=Pyrus ussuriensis x Pyrus communis TaxID=2448454 RepID=A0A5N5HLS5_9ROSA|nr:mitochondrial Rho GTPase 1-like [Pyrus ussuriensis x Pyrus communis]
MTERSGNRLAHSLDDLFYLFIWVFIADAYYVLCFWVLSLIVEASTNLLADQQMPVYNLASKILCRVINVSLKAEPDTDEVFAQVTLLPESNFSEWLCHTLLFFLSKRGRFAWLSLFQQVSGFLWLELQSTSFVADQKLPYLDFAAQCRHLNSITTNPIQGEGCRTLWNCRKCRSPTRNWRCHHPSILGSFRPLELAGSGEQSVSVLECTGIKEANSRC